MTRLFNTRNALRVAAASALMMLVGAALLASASGGSNQETTRIEVVAPWLIHPRAVDGVARRHHIPDSSEHPRVHYHAHLTIMSHGQVIVVPAGVGFDAAGHPVALHTHYPDGIIHVESDHEFHPTLGEFLSLWGVQVGRHSLGDRAGNVAVYLDGVRYRGAPSLAPIRDHEQITLVQGQFNGPIQSSYEFGPLP